MKKIISFIAFLLLFTLSSMQCNAQFSLDYGSEKEIASLKNSTLYIIIDQDAHENNPEYAKIVEENWTFSKVEIIESRDFIKYLKPGNFFLTLTTMYPEGFNLEKSPASLIHFYYQLWTPEPDYLKKLQKRNYKNIDFSSLANSMASISLIFDKSESFKAEDVMSGEYFGNGLPLYRGLGIFKNYLQGFQNKLSNLPKNVYTFVHIKNEKELKALKKQVLYVPSTFLTDNTGSSVLSYTKNKRPLLDAKEIFVDYPYEYKVISIKELNEKILGDETIYYISKPTEVEINVTNSKTGEMISHSFVKENGKTSKKELKELIKDMKDL